MGKFRDFNAVDLLTEQHAEIDKLFKVLEGKRGNRRETFIELADKLAAHATVEEKLFYPHIMSEAISDMLHDSVDEHLGIKRVLADLLTLDLDAEADEADELDAKLLVLKEQVSYHAHHEEEAKLFPIVREMMNEHALTTLGNELIVMFEHLMAAEPRKQVPRETTRAAVLPV